MFYLLIIIGCISIILGIFMGNTVETKEVESTSYKEVEELYLLNNRIEYLEKILLEDIPDIEEITIDEEVGTEITRETTNIEDSSYGLEQYKLVLQYEREDYSLEEICAHLNMNKGEVLLLKNLYKNYSN